jgi:hypothetical protein
MNRGSQEPKKEIKKRKRKRKINYKISLVLNLENSVEILLVFMGEAGFLLSVPLFSALVLSVLWFFILLLLQNFSAIRISIVV